MLGVGGFFSQIQKQKTYLGHCTLRHLGSKRNSSNLGLKCSAKWEIFACLQGISFNKSKLIKSLGKYSPENAVSAVLPPYLHALPLPTTLLSWEQWVLPPEQWKGTARTQLLLCWLREELILCKFSSGFFTHHFTTPYPYLHTKEKLEKFHRSWL